MRIYQVYQPSAMLKERHSDSMKRLGVAALVAGLYLQLTRVFADQSNQRKDLVCGLGGMAAAMSV